MKDLSIVVPVFNALEETVDCINSILLSDAATAKIIIMDDASSSVVASTLKEKFAGLENVEIISSFRNRGYSRNINFGIDRCSTEFVCILNSDTLVPCVWASPLLGALKCNPLIAGVGPVSNAASYQSVPDVKGDDGRFSVNNGAGFVAEERERMNMVLRHFVGDLIVDWPILNGFCTIFRRSCLDELNGLDVESFPQGYGEENDLAIRIKSLGYRLALVPGVFVHHQKSKSFGHDRKAILSKIGAETLTRKYGPRLVPSLAGQMEASRPLQLLRSVIKPYNDNVDEVVDLKVGDVIDCSSLDKVKLLSVSGPARVSISNNILSVYDADENSDSLFSIDGISDHELLVNIPPARTLSTGSVDVLATVLLWLALQSHTSPVILRDWKMDVEGLGIASGEIFDMLYCAQKTSQRPNMPVFSSNIGASRLM